MRYIHGCVNNYKYNFICDNQLILVPYGISKNSFTVCGGGVWFDNSTKGKETIENVQMFQLGLKLARLEKELEQQQRKY